jgi:PucR family transcriptional regulator, purine catabolism regulatory protein
MLTLSEALALPELTGATIIAGHLQSEQRIAWVHVVGVPDAAQWLNGGEFVLTTANALPTNDADQRDYIHALAQKGVVALGLAVGRFIDHAPPALRAAAEALDFPLVEVPWQVRFVDVAKAINERITASNMRNVEQALAIHRRLNQLILEGGNLQSLAETLASLIHQSVSIESSRFEAFASFNLADYDEARSYTLKEGRTDPRLVHALEERGILGQIRTTLRPVNIPPMPDVGLQMERILAPIVVHGDLYGYIWIIADDRPLSDLDRLAIESGATVAALMIFHQEAVQNAEASLKGGLLAQLIQREAGREAIIADQALRYGLDVNAPLTMYMLDTPDRSALRLAEIDRRLNRLLANAHARAVVGQFAGQIVVLAQHGNDELAQLIITANPDTRIAVSAMMSGGDNIPTLYAQCQETLFIARRIHPTESVVYFRAIGYLHTLYRAGSASLDSNPHVLLVQRLMGESGSSLLHTLEVYLDAGGNGVETAERLSIHRSTLNYRLERIEALCGVRLNDAITRTNLQVALKLMRLFGSGDILGG